MTICSRCLVSVTDTPQDRLCINCQDEIRHEYETQRMERLQRLKDAKARADWKRIGH